MVVTHSGRTHSGLKQGSRGQCNAPPITGQKGGGRIKLYADLKQKILTSNIGGKPGTNWWATDKSNAKHKIDVSPDLNDFKNISRHHDSTSTVLFWPKISTVQAMMRQLRTPAQKPTMIA